MNRRTLAGGAAILVLVAAGAGWYFTGSGRTTEKKAPPPAIVATARAEQGDVTLTLVLTGRTEAPEAVSIRARVDGQVAESPSPEGRAVGRGDILVRLDDADFKARRDQAEANLARDQAQLTKAQADLDRAQSLKARGFLSDAAIDTNRAALESARATVAADRAALELARLQLEYTVVRAPIAGMTGARLVFPGTAVKANDTILAQVSRVQPLLVTFNVPERHLARLRAGARHDGGAVRVSLAGSTQSITGRLRFLDATVDTSTGTVLAKAEIANADQALSPGQFVTVSVDIETLHQAISVPAAAIQQGPSGAFVYMVGEGDTAVLRPVTIAAEQDGRVVIAEGLAAGDTVVTDGQLRLVPGARLRLAEAK
jgi:multidrug efflux system membrane fusion protein